VVLGLEACFKEVVTRSDYQNPTRLSEKVLLAKGARVDQVVAEVGRFASLQRIMRERLLWSYCRTKE
jgi:hypothetical protein